ncbi:MAG TPA: biotin-independent malonate decarboxylase subunit gamma [Casimicrobiaceae bacterium]|nr:biotin-independent malonate decarboxylase subunit gamma [Casimicrobiaceae bacterium]
MSDTRAAHLSASPAPNSLRDAAPLARIGAIADVGSVVARPALGPSPHVARFGLALRDDDGVAIASAKLGGAPVMIGAQDARYLAGSVGERHGHALAAMFDAARNDKVSAIVLLLASGGVRLHEANAAELALARALRALLDARIAGIAVVALAVGNVFGGTSVLACAADRFAMLPSSRLGLSGPKVLESVHGAWELDATDARDVDAVYGAQARQRAGLVELVADDADAIRAWIVRAVRERDDFEAAVLATHARLARRVEGDAVQSPAFAALPCFADAAPVDAARLLWRAPRCWLTRPHTATTVGPADAHALDAALLANVAVRRATRPPLAIVEDSAGHTVSRAAEMKMVSHYLAHHASVLALLRAKGTPLVGLLAGIGHSAAFFSNALQADRLYALSAARVVAMEPAAVARVTGIAAASLVEDDPLLGQPVRHFAAQGGVTAILEEATLDAMGIA